MRSQISECQCDLCLETRAKVAERKETGNKEKAHECDSDHNDVRTQQAGLQ